MMAAMRENLLLETIHCESCVHRLAAALAPLQGLNEARIELASSSVVVDYDDDAMRATLDAAIEGAGFTIAERTPAAVS